MSVVELGERMRKCSHQPIRSAVEEIFNQYFTEEMVKTLSDAEIQLLSDSLAYQLTKEVNNAILYRTYQLLNNIG